MRRLPHDQTAPDARWSASIRIATAAVLGCLLVCGLAGRSGAQTRGIRFEHIRTAQGLPVESVTCIVQDRIGFMWIGTQDGLVRYDGRSFAVFRHDINEDQTLPNDHIQALLEDVSGDLWIGTLGGLSRWHFDRGTFTHYLHDPNDPDSLGGNHIQSLFQDRDGILWIGTNEDGLDRFDPEAEPPRFEHFRQDDDDPFSLGDDLIWAVFEDRRGMLWIGTDDGLGLFDRASGAFTTFRRNSQNAAGLGSNQVRSIFEDRQGTLWIATSDAGIYRVDRETFAFERFPRDGPASSLADNTVRVVMEDRDDRLWIGTDGGLHLVDRVSGAVHEYRHDPADVTSLSANRVTAIYQDRGGVLWVGTQGGGVNKWNPLTWMFSHQRVVAGEPGNPVSNDVFALVKGRDGGLWIGTAGGGLHHVDPDGGTEQFVHRPGDPGSLTGNGVSALLEDRRGRLWAGTLRTGLNRLDPGAGAFRHFVHDPKDDRSLGSNGVATLYEDRRGTLWVGTFNGGLNRFEEATGTFARHLHDADDPTSLSNDRVTVLTEDGEGDLWIGTYDGLNRFSAEAPERGFLSFRRDPGRPGSLAGDQIFSLHVDREGVLWVGTDTGLHRLEQLDEARGEAVFRRYLQRDGLPNNTIYGIHESGGELWLSTNQGLSRFDPRTETFENYTASHGLQANEFNMGAHFRSASGELLFGGVNGFNVFRPGEIVRNSAEPSMAITDFSMPGKTAALDRPVYVLDEIHLDYSDSVFSFEFAALDYSAPEENRYEYKLEGRDDDWIDLGNHPRVTFSKIDPGSYVFRVRGSNNDGVWNEEGVAIGIHIQPPFWKTWWFQLISFLAAGAMVAAFLRARMVRVTAERLKVLVAERTRELEVAQEQLFRRKKLAVLGELAGSVAHELRNPLGAIKNALYLLDMKEPDARTLKKYLGLIDEEIQRSDRIISEFLDWGREAPAAQHRFPLQEIVRQALVETEVPDGVTIDRRIVPEPLQVYVDPGQILRILKNFLSNAIEAMPAGGELRVECGRRGEEVYAAVVDTGVGISEDDISKIFEPLVTRKSKGVGLGLPLSQRYAERNSARIECESRLGEGSTFRLVLPPATSEALEPEPAAVAAS